MVNSDLKNTIDLIKNINSLQLNFNNQNLSFKQYSRNSKHITFTNQAGIDINVPLEELNNQYKKKYTVEVESSVDTSIFNTSKYNENILNGGNYSNEISTTSNSFMSKINNNNFAIYSNTSNSSVGSQSNVMSATSNNSFYGGNLEELSMTSLDETSVFETESVVQQGGYNQDVNSVISIDLNNFKLDLSDTDSINYNLSSTLNSLTEMNNYTKSNNTNDSKVLDKFLRQSGGGNNNTVSGFRSYNINSSSTSSVCE